MPSAGPTLLRLLSSPHGIAILVFVVAYLLAASVLRPYSIRDPSSAFFDPEIGFARSYSLIREEEAKAYIDASAASTPYTPTDTASPTLCIGIPTVQRDNARYFKTTMGSILSGLSAPERQQIILLPLIAQTDPTQHIAFNESWSHALPDRLLTYDLSGPLAAHVQALEAADVEHREKSRFDYVYALRACYNTSTPYILMLEDDVLAVRGWFPRLQAALAQLEARRGRVDATLYVRLFYTEKLLGWNSEEWPSYVAWSLGFEVLLGAGLWFLRRRGNSSGSGSYNGGRGGGGGGGLLSATARFLSRPTCLAILGLAGPAVVVLYFAAGRMTVQPLPRGLSPMDAFGCCSQALLFPRDRVPALAAYVGDIARSRPVDSVIEEFANAGDWRRWAVAPALYQHIGSQSSKVFQGQKSSGRWGRPNAANLWNFEYERYKVKASGGS